VRKQVKTRISNKELADSYQAWAREKSSTWFLGVSIGSLVEINNRLFRVSYIDYFSSTLELKEP